MGRIYIYCENTICVCACGGAGVEMGIALKNLLISKESQIICMERNALMAPENFFVHKVKHENRHDVHICGVT